MIKYIFSNTTLASRLETGPLGSHLDLLATALQNQGYARTTIGIHLREVHAFGCWLQEQHQLDEINEPMLERYLDALSSQEEPLTKMQRQKITTAIHLLLKHLRHAGVIGPVHSKKSILQMKTSEIGCAETNFHFKVAICILLS